MDMTTAVDVLVTKLEQVKDLQNRVAKDLAEARANLVEVQKNRDALDHLREDLEKTIEALGGTTIVIEVSTPVPLDETPAAPAPTPPDPPATTGLIGLPTQHKA